MGGSWIIEYTQEGNWALGDTSEHSEVLATARSPESAAEWVREEFPEASLRTSRPSGGMVFVVGERSTVEIYEVESVDESTGALEHVFILSRAIYASDVLCGVYTESEKCMSYFDSGDIGGMPIVSTHASRVSENHEAVTVLVGSKVCPFWYYYTIRKVEVKR